MTRVVAGHRLTFFITTEPKIEINTNNMAVQTAQKPAATPAPPVLAIFAAEIQATTKAIITKPCRESFET